MTDFNTFWSGKPVNVNFDDAAYVCTGAQIKVWNDETYALSVRNLDTGKRRAWRIPSQDAAHRVYDDVASGQIANWIN